MRLGLIRTTMPLVRDDVEASARLLFEARVANAIQGADIRQVITLDVLRVPVPLGDVAIPVTGLPARVGCIPCLDHARVVNLMSGKVVESRFSAPVARRNLSLSTEHHLYIVSIIRRSSSPLVSRVCECLQQWIETIMNIPLLSRLQKIVPLISSRLLLVVVSVSIGNDIEVFDLMRWNQSRNAG